MNKYLSIALATIVLGACSKSPSETTSVAAPAAEPTAAVQAQAAATPHVWGDATLFETSQTVIFSNNFDTLTYNQLSVKSQDATQLSAQSEGEDPTITFPELNIAEGKNYIVAVKFNASVSAELQLFFSVAGNTGYPFSEENSIKAPVVAGDNHIYLQLTHANLGKFLRLDPINLPGTLTIHSLSIKQVD